MIGVTRGRLNDHTLHAALQDHSAKLGPGEFAVVALIAQNRRQARNAMNFCKGLANASGLIRSAVVKETEESITFAHRVILEVQVASFRSIRGFSFATIVLDELAVYFDDIASANPDTEIVRAARPGLSNLGGRLIGLSTPRGKRGHLYAMYAAHFGRANSDVMVLQAPGRMLNPLISQAVIDKAFAEDPVSAKMEWGAEFGDEVNQAFPTDLVNAAIPERVLSRPYEPGITYHAFLDAASGVAEHGDAMTMAISHQSLDGKVVLDRLAVADPPFDTDAVAQQFADIMSAYRVPVVTGDRWGLGFVGAAFGRHGVSLLISDLEKSMIYRECLPLFANSLVSLLDNPRLRRELIQLERRPGSNGRPEKIDHPPRANDDACNSVCGSLLLSARSIVTRNDGFDSVTHATTSYDPMQRGLDEYRPVQRRPRAVGSLANMRFEEDFDRADVSYDPLNRD